MTSTGRASDMVLQEHLGVGERDQSFYYSTPACKQRISLIQHLLEYGDQGVLVTADAGMGKTRMLNRLLYSGDRWLVCGLSAAAGMEPPVLLKRLFTGFSLPASLGRNKPATLRKRLDERLATLGDGQRIPVVFVDDAHQLPVDSMILLFQLAGPDGQRNAIRLALFADPRIEDVLDIPELNVTVPAFMSRLSLPAFTEQQTREYLVRRSAAAGREGPLPISAAEVRRIYQQTRGVPADIDTLVGETLFKQRDRPGRGPVGGRSKRRKRFSIGWKIPLGIIGSVLLAVLVWMVLPEPDSPVADRQLQLDVPPPTEHDVETMPIDPLPGNGSIADSGKVDRDPPPLPQQRSQSPAGHTSGVKDVEWLLTQPDDRYVVQLLSSRNKEAVMEFLDEHKDIGGLAWFETVNQGVTWYVVVHGLYPDQESAQAALPGVAKLAPGSKPWPRSIGGIKETIRNKP